MDQPMDGVVENSTVFSSENYIEYEIHAYIQTAVCILSMISDLLIVAIILKSKRMRTRTNNLIMHFAIADAFCMLNEMGLIYFIYEQLIYKIVATRSYCMFAIYEVTSQLASLLFIFFLLSNTLIKTKRLSDKTLLIGYYAIIGSLFFVHTLFCALHHTYFPVFHMILLFVFLIILISLLAKEVNRCIKICKKRPLGQKTAFRMNIARIYVYSWLFTAFTYQVNNIFILYLSLVGFFSGFLILLYLTCSNRNFKICLLNLLRFRTQNYDVDATISFGDDCSQYSDDTQPAVNITFNGTSQPEANIIT